MRVARETVTNAAVGIGVGDTPDGLSVIHHPGAAAAIWRRRPLPAFRTWLDALPPSQLPQARVMLRAADVQEAVTGICNACGTPDDPERARLIDDSAALADIFATLMDTAYLRLRFDVVTTSACPKFHIDAVTARLICTYRGPGTQYGISTDGAEPRRIFTVPTGAPILLRGTLWPSQPKSGLLHRSPPIEGTGETRLVLVLDPVDEPQERTDHRALH